MSSSREASFKNSFKFHNLVYFDPMIIDPRNNRKQNFALCCVSFTG